MHRLCPSSLPQRLHAPQPALLSGGWQWHQMAAVAFGSQQLPAKRRMSVSPRPATRGRLPSALPALRLAQHPASRPYGLPEHQCAELLYAGIVPCVRTTPRLQHLKAKEKIHVLGWAFGEALTEKNSLEGGEHGILQKTFKAAYKPYQHASVEILLTSMLFFSLLYYCAVVL